jgi:hypothetical protein
MTEGLPDPRDLRMDVFAAGTGPVHVRLTNVRTGKVGSATGEMYVRARDAALQALIRGEEPTADWCCHLCADGGLTPWPPGTECPNYPCQAFQRPRDQ